MVMMIHYLLKVKEFVISIPVGTTCGDVEDEENCKVFMKLESGYVCGTLRAGANGSRYRSFRGVPYAKPPLAELRFKVLFCIITIKQDIINMQDNLYTSKFLSPLGTMDVSRRMLRRVRNV